MRPSHTQWWHGAKKTHVPTHVQKTFIHIMMAQRLENLRHVLIKIWRGRCPPWTKHPSSISLDGRAVVFSLTCTTTRQCKLGVTDTVACNLYWLLHLKAYCLAKIVAARVHLLHKAQRRRPSSSCLQALHLIVVYLTILWEGPMRARASVQNSFHPDPTLFPLYCAHGACRRELQPMRVEAFSPVCCGG